jgi:hypothetical protein
MPRHSSPVSQDGVYQLEEVPPLGITRAAGNTVPSDGDLGYAPNCVFIDLDATGGSGIYVNRGTKASANFDLVAVTNQGPVAIADGTTYAVLALNSGRTHVLPNVTSTITVTLPTAASGLEYTFISKAVAADAQDWKFDTGSAAAFYLGGVVHLDSNAGAAADELVLVVPNGSTNDILTVTTPEPGGTAITFLCDGTNWIVSGSVLSATAPAFSDT